MKRITKMPDRKDSFIKVENIFFKYKNENVISNCNLELQNKFITGLIGRNGSGKTTLGKLIAGILKPTKGKVLINRKNTKELNLGEIGQTIGYLFQNPETQLFAHSVKEELSFVLEINNIEKSKIKNKIDNLLSNFHLSHLLECSPFDLSEGEKRRLAIVALLMNDPQFIILDEPTIGLDYKRKNIFIDMLYTLNNNGVGILIISHDEELIHNHSNQIYEMQENGSVRKKK